MNTRGISQVGTFTPDNLVQDIMDVACLIARIEKGEQK